MVSGDSRSVDPTTLEEWKTETSQNYC